MKEKELREFLQTLAVTFYITGKTNQSLRESIKDANLSLFEGEFPGTMREECYYCKFRGEVPGSAHIMCSFPDEEMTGDPHGIKEGWFLYPFNFDPVWKTKKCNNFIQVREFNKDKSKDDVL